jgi:hypothetical protein
MWRDAGFNFGVYMQMCFPTLENLITLVAQLERSFNVCRVRFVEKPSLGKEGENNFSLEIVTSYSAEFLKYLGEYWRGALSSYGLETVGSSIAIGILKIRFICNGKLSKADPHYLFNFSRLKAGRL